MARSKSKSAEPRTSERIPRNARELAFDVLNRWSLTSAFVDQLFDARAQAAQLSALDRSLATEIAHGVVRRRPTLDRLLAQHLRRPFEELEPGLQILLELGAYQLVFLTAIPPHAALHESIEVARAIGQQRWTGFANAVLRSLSQAVTAEFAEQPGPTAVPLTGGRYRLMKQEVLPHPDRDFARYFAAAFSFPDWLTDRWMGRFSRDELLDLGFWFNSPAPLSLRINPLKSNRDTYLQQLIAAGIAAHAGRDPQSIVLDELRRIDQLPGFREGLFAVQDESAMTASRLLAPTPGASALDLCAAPGGKTTHLAELMENSGIITATDISDDRLRLVEESAARLGLDIIRTQVISPDSADVPEGPFDFILLDVPCSNTGVLGKRTEARWRLQPQDLVELTAIQQRLLRTALDRAAPGGRIVYSTCSMEPEENRAVVDAVLSDRPGFRLEFEQMHLPGRPADGAYQALILRE